MSEAIPHSQAFAEKASPVDTSSHHIGAAKTFCETDEVRALVRRGLLYLDAGAPIHFTGPAGIGKTALAFRLAGEIGRPVSLMTGHEGLTSDDFVGRAVGHRESVVVDKYIQSVRRKETTTRLDWCDAALADAMERGHTLLYDEFTRASPQANVALLSVLEEGVLVSSKGDRGRTYIRAHPDFRLILTSNPSDYVAVNSAPDALLDRLVTFHLSGYNAKTEETILASATGLDDDQAKRIVGIVRTLRTNAGSEKLFSMRTALLIGRIAAHADRHGKLSEGVLSAIVTDVVTGRDRAISAHTIKAAMRATSKAAETCAE